MPPLLPILVKAILSVLLKHSVEILWETAQTLLADIDKRREEWPPEKKAEWDALIKASKESFDKAGSMSTGAGE